MSILVSILALVTLVLGLVALAGFVRRDQFAGPANRAIRYGELGPLAYRRRPI